MSYLTLNHICKHWGDKRILDDITFDVAQGEFVALLGPSGCGKTTTLRTIAGLEQQDSGSIVINGQDVSLFAPAARKLSMVFQSYALFPHLSVKENLLFGLRARKENKQHFMQRLQTTSELLELTGLLDRLPGQLSGGQQQRVALGRAVIAENTLCLMDEPLSNLDAKLRQSMRREIRALQQRLGLTMIYVTHDQTEAMSMADRVILLKEGHIEQNATPEQLYNQPATLFCAQFIGSPPMNIIPLTKRGNSQHIGILPQAVLHSDHPYPLSVGIRAEDIQLTSIDEGRICCQIMDCEYLGGDTLVICALPGQQHLLTVKVSGKQRWTRGCRVGLNWLSTAQHFFCSHSGKRLIFPPSITHDSPRRLVNAAY
jgi:sn-glycerol 3-phosphate transport system ATP-binding protein